MCASPEPTATSGTADSRAFSAFRASRAARLVTPLKPFEALALGLPLVVSDLPALQEITGNGDRGRTFVTGDASSLADVLEELATSADARQELAAKGRDWVLGHRTWAHNDDRYARIYESVLGPR